MDESLRIGARMARAEITSGGLRGPELRARLESVPPRDRDAWVDELLGIDGMPADTSDLPRGSVPYLPSGVEEILAMVLEVPLRPDDVLVDVGSGLGRVLILGHLLSGARAYGVEIQSHLVRSARARCAELALHDVTFEEANAAETELDGSVFFLYAPFGGATLDRVTQRLECVARRRPIVVCTLDVVLREAPWLTKRSTSRSGLTLFDSCAPGVTRREAAC